MRDPFLARPQAAASRKNKKYDPAFSPRLRSSHFDFVSCECAALCRVVAHPETMLAHTRSEQHIVIVRTLCITRWTDAPKLNHTARKHKKTRTLSSMFGCPNLADSVRAAMTAAGYAGIHRSNSDKKEPGCGSGLCCYSCIQQSSPALIRANDREEFRDPTSM